MTRPVQSAQAAKHLRTRRTLLRRLLQTILPFCFFAPLHAQTPLPTSNATLDFGNVIAGEPSVQWFKIAQASPSLTVSTTPGSAFAAILAEDVGFGHGQPSSAAFSASFTSTCFNCWLGIQFLPPTTGTQTGTLTIAFPNTSSPYLLTLNGTGSPATGILLTPVAQDFGTIDVNSSSAAVLFTLTNLISSGSSITVASPSIGGDFVLSSVAGGGAPCGGSLAYSASCSIAISFMPRAIGSRAGSLTLHTSNGNVSAALTGTALPDTGLALSPSSLVFNTVPGLAATQQTISLTNTSGAPEQIGALAISGANFAASTNCAMLSPSATCSILVTFASTAAPAAANLSIPLTSVNGTTTITVPLTGAYTSDEAGLQILPSDPQYGPQSADTLGPPRQFAITNLSAKYAALTLDLPRQFVLNSPPCATLAPNASCNFSLNFVPLTNGYITGTLFAHATPADGSAALNGIAYVEGYGMATSTLAITGPLQPASVLNFGQLASGQSAQRNLTLTNTSLSAPLTIRRVTSPWPFLATTTCGTTLVPAQTCSISITYAPSNQVAANASPPPATADANLLTIESDSASSPDLINLTGSSTPIVVASPSNAASQAIISLSTSSLAFAGTLPGVTSPAQTITLTNTGTATLEISTIQSSTPDFIVSTSCSIVLAGTSCPVNISFTPQAAAGVSTRIGSIEISSNASVPLELISLIGTVTAISPAPSFALTVNGAATASATVKSGSVATYSLAITPLNGFSGTVALTCTPIAPAAYATCSVAPSSIALAASAQTATATITTVATMGSNSSPAQPASTFPATIFLSLILPATFLPHRGRTAHHHNRRHILWALFASITLISALACGGNQITPIPNRDAAPGNYQYQVTATSTAAGNALTQTVTLNLTVQ